SLDPGHIVHAATAKDLGAHAGVFRVARDTDAHESALRTRLALGAAQPVVIGGAERLLERLGEVAAVVAQAAGRHVRIGLARDEVATAYLGGIEAEPRPHEIHQPLHHERPHRHADAAIGA